MDKSTEKLIIEKNAQLTRDLIEAQRKKSDEDFINSEKLIVISEAVIEKGEIVFAS